MHWRTEVDLSPLLRDLGLLLGAVASVPAVSISTLPIALYSDMCISLDVERK